MRKGLLWILGLMMLLMAVPVAADTIWDGGGDLPYDQDYWQVDDPGNIPDITQYLGPDVSNITLEPLTPTDILIGQQQGSPITLQVKINGSSFSFDDYSYVDEIVSSNNQLGVFLAQVQNNVMTLNLYLYEGTDVSSNIYITINGKTFPPIPVRVRKINMDRSSVQLAKGKKTSLKLKCGSNTVSQKASWKSTNSKVASVDQNGKVTAKKVGNTVISATVNGQKVGCIVSVSTKKKIAAIKTAIKIVKTGKYSQSKRMRNGYFDCSSLVWKAYRKNGCKFGSSSYAPTAADQAKYMDKHGKSLGKCTQKRINSLYYQVGDVCYHTKKGYNRYKGIYHTELLVGYSFYGFNDSGAAVVGLNGIRSYFAVGDPMARP